MPLLLCVVLCRSFFSLHHVISLSGAFCVHFCFESDKELHAFCLLCQRNEQQQLLATEHERAREEYNRTRGEGQRAAPAVWPGYKYQQPKLPSMSVYVAVHEREAREDPDAMII